MIAKALLLFLSCGIGVTLHAGEVSSPEVEKRLDLLLETSDISKKPKIREEAFKMLDEIVHRHSYERNLVAKAYAVVLKMVRDDAQKKIQNLYDYHTWQIVMLYAKANVLNPTDGSLLLKCLLQQLYGKVYWSEENGYGRGLHFSTRMVLYFLFRNADPKPEVKDWKISKCEESLLYFLAWQNLNIGQFDYSMIKTPEPEINFYQEGPARLKMAALCYDFRSRNNEQALKELVQWAKKGCREDKSVFVEALLLSKSPDALATLLEWLKDEKPMDLSGADDIAAAHYKLQDSVADELTLLFKAMSSDEVPDWKKAPDAFVKFLKKWFE